jgi:putative colanic acid biosynthesis acetyltransferase WcaF
MLLCSWTPKPANAWRLFWLRVFGAKMDGRPFVHGRARIQIPWNLTLADGACVGDRANLYSLDHITLGPNCVIAQEAYLCTGTHDFSHDSLPLQTAPIAVGEKAFVGARAFVMPGISIGKRSVVGACSVVTRNVEEGIRVKGNPARAESDES